MPVALERREANWLIRMDGPITLTSAGELKNMLLEWLAAGKDLELDLEAAEDVDITILQLLCAAMREAARTGVGIAIRASGAVAAAVRDSGFSQIPGFPVLRNGP
jgi:anti-anti-sigma regulatory factor